MKKIIIPIFALCASVAFAADVTETTTTKTITSNGMITEYSPGKTFIIKETTGAVPYTYGKTVTYVTKKGTALTDAEVRTRIKVGIPVHVDYVTQGETRVINRIVVDED